MRALNINKVQNIKAGIDKAKQTHEKTRIKSSSLLFGHREVSYNEPETETLENFIKHSS